MHTMFHRVHDAFHHHHHHDRRHHMSRHERRGFAGFGGRDPSAADPSGAGFDHFRRGRKLGSADLQLLLLALLAERPSHGYELIKALDERSKGYYAPSPGMVYPALTYLEEIGHASVEAQGSRKLYQVTDAGKTQLEAQRPHVDALLRQLAYLGERMDAWRSAVDARGDGDADAAFERGPGGRGSARRAFGHPELRAARRSLIGALIDKAESGADEQRRIAAILERAAAEIRGSAGSAETGVPTV